MKEINSSVERGQLLDGRYKLLRPLSSDGGTADVWLALDTNTIDEIFDEESDQLSSDEESGIKVAIKIYRPKNALDLGEQRFREEFKIVFNCHHSNLIQPINFSISEGVPYLVLPYCESGSSEKLQGTVQDKHELWKYISDVSSGLAYLHAFNPTIVHHDIKPANILIDDNNNFAITDFGISSHRGLNREGYDTTQSGTMAYMAPERFKEDYESTPESDIWSFGATLYELITGNVPFGENGGAQQLENKDNPPTISQDVPSDIKRLVNDCLNIDPSKRPTASEIHNAALSEQYPKMSFLKYGIGALILAVMIVACILIFGRSNNSTTDTLLPSISNDEYFASAMILMNNESADSLQKGLSILDSLGSIGYIPALYEQAFTYGWYPDSASCSRKKLLGLEYHSNKEYEGMPVSFKVNNKAISYLSAIDERNDSTYPNLNAQALYRLAVYYANDNEVYKRDTKRALALLEKALDWAELSNDMSLIDKIKRNIDFLQKELN